MLRRVFLAMFVWKAIDLMVRFPLPSSVRKAAEYKTKGVYAWSSKKR